MCCLRENSIWFANAVPICPSSTALPYNTIYAPQLPRLVTNEPELFWTYLLDFFCVSFSYLGKDTDDEMKWP